MATSPHQIKVSAWPGDPQRPRMANAVDQRSGLGLSDRGLERDGVPFIPISGEVHYSRIPRDRWEARLRSVVAAGVTVVSTYVPWLHHVPDGAGPQFGGNLDVGAFIDACGNHRLDVVLRIGPWCHGELRNGGFPDWVAAADVVHRTDDPRYLELVEEWFGQLAGHLGRRAGPDGDLLAIQLENELYDQPDHLRSLKALARRAGLAAPLWTATAWGGAQLPAGEVFPVYGGYGDGFWVASDAGWDPSFREHFFFSHQWDDPGIGADLRSDERSAAAASVSAEFPPATCELGGGMATAYHRRPVLAPLDVATPAWCKIGNGSAWQGYYMFAGGTNPAGGWQESQATGYPNDLPRLSYDFQAPIGEAGELNGSHAELRRQHAFLTAFGAGLTELPSWLPEVRPANTEDRTTPRWAVRSDGDKGYLFLAWHQAHEQLDPLEDVQFEIGGATPTTVPSEPITIRPGTLACWPVFQEYGGVMIEWITATPLTLLAGSEAPVLVLIADHRMPVELRLPPGVAIQSQAETSTTYRLTPSEVPVRLVSATGALDLLVLPATLGPDLWVREHPDRTLLLSDCEISWYDDGPVQVVAAGELPRLRRYDPAGKRFVEAPLSPAPTPGRIESAQVELIRPAAQVPATYGERDGRAASPQPSDLERLAGRYRVTLPDWVRGQAVEARLCITWAGDVAELEVDGVPVADRFWDGRAWTVDVRDTGLSTAKDVVLRVLPLSPDSPIWLPSEAQAVRANHPGQLLRTPTVEVVELVLVSDNNWSPHYCSR
ncbi:beta-galactosidase [Kribbella antibiotica]|nr:beta-galactosidase [Kribbella antibiotica]